MQPQTTSGGPRRSPAEPRHVHLAVASLGCGVNPGQDAGNQRLCGPSAATGEPAMHVLEISGPSPSGDASKVLTKEALRFVAELEDQFGPRRLKLLENRRSRDTEIAGGRSYGVLTSTEAVRRGDWKVAAAPADLERRHVEITGPVERKMMINAL